MTDGHQTREFNFVTDLANGLAKAGSVSGIDGTLMNLGCGEEITIHDLTVKVLDLMGNPITPVFGALPERQNEIHRMYCDSSRARAALDWAPQCTLDEGLLTTIDWYRQELTDPSSPFGL